MTIVESKEVTEEVLPVTNIYFFKTFIISHGIKKINKICVIIKKIIKQYAKALYNFTYICYPAGHGIFSVTCKTYFSARYHLLLVKGKRKPYVDFFKCLISML